jgi:hypothetical protein
MPLRYGDDAKGYYRLVSDALNAPSLPDRVTAV